MWASRANGDKQRADPRNPLALLRARREWPS
jgi:hypothetical protein